MQHYTLAQYKAQAEVLIVQIEDEDRRLASLMTIPEDVRENHKRTILMRRNSFVKRLNDLNVLLSKVE